MILFGILNLDMFLGGEMIFDICLILWLSLGLLNWWTDEWEKKEVVVIDLTYIPICMLFGPLPFIPWLFEKYGKTVLWRKKIKED